MKATVQINVRPWLPAVMLKIMTLGTVTAVFFPPIRVSVAAVGTACTTANDAVVVVVVCLVTDGAEAVAATFIAF